jgi:AAA15 family ATPase/GTPase
MIKEIRIENFKSVQSLKLELGRITVLIGENGGGKSNILEAIALASAAITDKLDNEFLAARGIRVTEPQLMRAAFDAKHTDKEIKLYIETDKGDKIDFNLHNDNKPYSQWKTIEEIILDRSIINAVSATEEIPSYLKRLKNNFQELFNFLIYSPESVSLRTFEKEGQIQPLGINGEGLLKLLTVLNSSEDSKKIEVIKEKLELIDWFRGFDLIQNPLENRGSIKIRDKYLDKNLEYFDQKSSNEGFLFLLFYFSLFISDNTPNFFAIDNIDASLNPKLCSQLVKELVGLSKQYDKQSIFTTHNPATLDGLNLDDDEQRLFVVSRNKLGHTTLKRIFKPKTIEGQEPVKLSEAFGLRSHAELWNEI